MQKEWGIWVWNDAATATLRQKLLYFGTLQLADATWAEEVVQETLIKAFTQQAQYESATHWQASVIKLLDHNIQATLTSQALDWTQTSEEEAQLDKHQQLSEEDGTWPSFHQPTSHSSTPITSCLAALPPNTARIYLLRQLMGLDIEQIKHITGLPKQACHTILNRARFALCPPSPSKLRQKHNPSACQQTWRLLSEQSDRALSVMETWHLYKHLLVCQACRADQYQLRQLRQNMAHLSRQKQQPVDLTTGFIEA